MEKNHVFPKITPQFLIEMLIRRRWFMLIPLCLALIVGIWLEFVLPKAYQAQTLIIVESQRVPQNYVRSIITEDPAQRIATISQQILSTSNLERIIKEFGLFDGPEFEKVYLEDKVASLRKKISVDVIGNRLDTEAFTITFKGRDPQKVMMVANGLASSFINENIKNRESQATGTSQFLDAELESMRTKLEKVEEAIKDYRKNHMGELPEQLQTNLTIMDRLQQNLTVRQQQLREAKIRLNDLQNQSKSNAAQIVVIQEAGRVNQPAGTSLQDLRTELQALQSRYTDKHPDIVRLKSRIAEMEREFDNSSENKDGNASSYVPVELRVQINQSQREIMIGEREIEDLESQIADYQRRVEATPRREQDLLSLKRDYQNIQASYDSLLNRKLEADIAVNMERKQKGERFRVVDPARLPQRPIEPDLRKLFVLVVAMGLGIGGGASFLLEYLDTSYRDPDELESQYGIPVLATIPFLAKRRDIILRKINLTASLALTGITCVLFMVLGLMSLKGPEILGKIF